MIEKWLPIPGMRDYQGSNLGRVRNVKFNKVRVLTTFVRARGEQSVTIILKGVRRQHKIKLLLKGLF